MPSMPRMEIIHLLPSSLPHTSTWGWARVNGEHEDPPGGSSDLVSTSPLRQDQLEDAPGSKPPPKIREVRPSQRILGLGDVLLSPAWSRPHR